ncbi:MAG TPA: glycosyltransferase family 9 protein, partial [Egibacteraceae bacterium]
ALDVAVPARLQPGGLADATLLHPGATSPARRWPVERWAAVARREAAAGRRVVVTAGPGEHALATMVTAAAGLPPDTVRRPPDVVALAGLVAAVGRVVCGDTGVAHLATAVGTRSVVLFGPASPRRWGPPPGRPRHRALWRGDGAGGPHADGDDDALLRIGVDDVVAALADAGAPLPRV